ncbi:hypothetical protein D3C86_1610650 [compost metagenome]
MKFSVELRDLMRHDELRERLHFSEQFIDTLWYWRPDIANASCGVGFEDNPRLEELVHFAWGNCTNPCATPGDELDESLGAELVERLSDRRSGHTNFIGNDAFFNKRTRRKLATQNAIANVFVCPFFDGIRAVFSYFFVHGNLANGFGPFLGMARDINRMPCRQS